MEVNSRFAFRAYVVLFISIAFTVVCVWILVKNLPMPIEEIRWIHFYMAILFAFTFCFLVFGELRKKIVRVKIVDSFMSKRAYFGFWTERRLRYEELDGFTISAVRSKDCVHEYLYVMKDGIKVVKISEAYHTNYQELKNAISCKLDNMGFVHSGFRSEFLEIFSR